MTTKNVLTGDFIPPDQALSFEPAEFDFNFRITYEMIIKPGLFNRPADYGFNDVVENRLGLAVKQVYRRDPQKRWSFMWRVHALWDLISSGALEKRFFSAGREQPRIHPAVIELSAWFPLTSQGRFSRKAFLNALKRKAKVKGSGDRNASKGEA